MMFKILLVLKKFHHLKSLKQYMAKTKMANMQFLFTRNFQNTKAWKVKVIFFFTTKIMCEQK